MSDLVVSTEELIASVEANKQQLAPHERSLAEGIIQTLKRSKKAPSEKQRYLLEKFSSVPSAPKQQRETRDVGDMSGIMKLFDHAAARLSHPKINILLADTPLRLSLAGPGASVPGSINVVATSMVGDNWMGRVLRDGRFEMSPRVKVPETVIAALREFSRDPAGVAAKHGHTTGSCCFCNIPLRDARSIEVGYGPICAQNFNLSWGEGSVASRVRLRGARSVVSYGE